MNRRCVQANNFILTIIRTKLKEGNKLLTNERVLYLCCKQIKHTCPVYINNMASNFYQSIIYECLTYQLTVYNNCTQCWHWKTCKHLLYCHAYNKCLNYEVRKTNIKRKLWRVTVGYRIESKNTNIEQYNFPWSIVCVSKEVRRLHLWFIHRILKTDKLLAPHHVKSSYTPASLSVT